MLVMAMGMMLAIMLGRMLVNLLGMVIFYSCAGHVCMLSIVLGKMLVTNCDWQNYFLLYCGNDACLGAG